MTNDQNEQEQEKDKKELEGLLDSFRSTLKVRQGSDSDESDDFTDSDDDDLDDSGYDTPSYLVDEKGDPIDGIDLNTPLIPEDQQLRLSEKQRKFVKEYMKTVQQGKPNKSLAWRKAAKIKDPKRSTEQVMYHWKKPEVREAIRRERVGLIKSGKISEPTSLMEEAQQLYKLAKEQGHINVANNILQNIMKVSGMYKDTGDSDEHMYRNALRVDDAFESFNRLSLALYDTYSTKIEDEVKKRLWILIEVLGLDIYITKEKVFGPRLDNTEILDWITLEVKELDIVDPKITEQEVRSSDLDEQDDE